MFSFCSSTYPFTVFERCVAALSIKISQSCRLHPQSELMKLSRFFKNSSKVFAVTDPRAAAAKTEPVDVIAVIREVELTNQTLLTEHSFPFSSQEWVAFVYLENKVSSMFTRIWNLLSALVSRTAKRTFVIRCLSLQIPKGLDFPFLKLSPRLVFRISLTTCAGMRILQVLLNECLHILHDKRYTSISFKVCYFIDDHGRGL